MLPKLQRTVAVEVMDLVSTRTEQGATFVTDARLRPDGDKGLLVNTLAAYEDYYRRRARLWEIQALTRSRPVAGNQVLGQQFVQLAGALMDFRETNVRGGFQKQPRVPAVAPGLKVCPKSEPGLAAYTPGWREEIRRMRRRVEQERTPAGQDALAIKTGAGGLMDAEFLAQTFSLAHGWQEAGTLRALERAKAGGILPGADADRLIEGYRQLRRVEGILRRWSFEGETVLPDEAAPSPSCGRPLRLSDGGRISPVTRELAARYSRCVRPGVWRLNPPETSSRRAVQLQGGAGGGLSGSNSGTGHEWRRFCAAVRG